jgi:hypothetical protein
VERTEQQGGRSERGAMDAGRTGAQGGAEAIQAGSAANAPRSPRAEPLRDAKDKINDTKSTIADKLESGAGSLRSRTREGAERVAAATSDLGAAATQRLQNYSDTVATRMERTAGWLRRRDVGDVGENIVQQVQKHPVRSLLIAVGIGYLLGRSLSD